MKTKSICEKCFNEAEANYSIEGNNVFLDKKCRCGNVERNKIESDVKFFNNFKNQHHNIVWDMMLSTTALDITNRCNVSCPHCYKIMDKSPDKPIEKILEESKNSKRGLGIILMGAEPTVRNDLPSIIEELKKQSSRYVGIYTNGIRLSNLSYVETLKKSGLDFVCLSMHLKNYLGEEIKLKKDQALQNIKNSGIYCHHVSYTLSKISEVDECLRDIHKIIQIPHHFRIRCPSDSLEEFDLSLLCSEFERIVESYNWKYKIDDADNNLYHVVYEVEKFKFRLIKQPTVKNCDLNLLQGPPFAYGGKTGETNLALAFFIHKNQY